jgi:hypothetical protein
MKKLIFSTLFLALTQIAFSQWVSSLGYSTFKGDNSGLSSAKGQSISTGDGGSCYVAGFCNDATLHEDLILIKYNQFGDTLWVKTYSGNANLDDKAFGMVVDYNGFIYVTGYATDNVTGKNIILLKYSSYGELIWVKQYTDSTASLEDAGLAIVLDLNQFVYITGYYTNPADNHEYLIIQKYDSSGTLMWTNSIVNGNGQGHGNAITIDHESNIYVTGYCNTVDSSNIIIVKYNSSGDRQWETSYNGQGNGEDKAFGIVVDDLDNVYVTGYETNTSMNTDCVTLKYNSSGILQFNSFYNGSGNVTDKAFGIVVDADGCPIITGSTFNGSNLDFVTIKYSTTGVQQWVSIYDYKLAPGNDEAKTIGYLNIDSLTKYVIVAGESYGNYNDYDYQTYIYNASDGSSVDSTRYTFSTNSNDVPTDLIVTPDNNVYITGYSELIIQSFIPQSQVTTMKLNFSNKPKNNFKNNIPSSYKLYQNYPNPFNPSTTIKFDITKGKDIKLTIYDLLGRTVEVLVNKYYVAGSYSINYTNSSLASGIYFYELKTDEYRDVKKMTLIK